jgi:hypothetical protein
MFSMSLPNNSNFLAGYQLRLGITAPPHFPDGTDCFRERHRLCPFHRVEHWSGDHFGAAWLCQAAVVIQLGHSGGCCPAEGHTQNDSQLNADDEDDEDLDNVGMDESDDDWEDGDISFPAVNEQSVLPDLKDKDVVIVIDVSGVHKIQVLPCRCPNALTLEHQYLEMGFFPTSFLVIKSVVTFSTLEDQHLDNLECKTAVLKYWNKVQRKTAPVDWNKLPVSDHTCHWLFILVLLVACIEPISGIYVSHKDVAKYSKSYSIWVRTSFKEGATRRSLN